MAKLSKMELEAVARKIITEVKEAKLPELIEEWERKQLLIESDPLYKKAKKLKLELDEKAGYDTGNSYVNLSALMVNVFKGSHKPNINTAMPGLSSYNIIDALIIAQVSDTNLTDVIARVKQQFLTD